MPHEQDRLMLSNVVLNEDNAPLTVLGAAISFARTVGDKNIRRAVIAADKTLQEELIKIQNEAHPDNAKAPVD